MQIFVTQVSNPHFLQDPQSTQELLKKPTFILGKNLLTNLGNRMSGWGTGKKKQVKSMVDNQCIMIYMIYIYIYI